MKRRYLVWFAAGAQAVAPAAGAQEITLTPLAEARMRLEDVEQDDLPLGSTAVTTRVRTGVRAAAGDWSALVQAQGTLSLGGRYFDGLEGDTRRPTIADPQNIALYRAQLSFTRADRLAITAGRQVLELADQRFVGSAQFRQNAQTFDAVRTQWSPLPRLSADLTYAWSVRTVNGIDGRGARQRAVDGGNFFALLGYRSPVGTVTGFAYLVDQNEAPVQQYRLSSQSYGLRFSGTRAFAPAWSASYAAQWSRQSDYKRNPNDYRADEWMLETTVARKAISATLGYEVLGASRGAPFTSFQTPLAAIFKFQGWADKFATTPPDGVRDLYAGAAGSWKRSGVVKAWGVQAMWHRFDSDRLIRHYGDEWNLLASATIARTTFSARFASYDADRFSADTRKFWLSADWAL